MEEEEEIRPILRVGQRIMGRTKRLEKAVYPTRCKLSRGMKSAKGKNMKALTWKCPKCGKVNRSERRLLVILPVILCACGEEFNVQFDFLLHKVEFNDHFLIPIIRKQNPKECSPCSMLALAEISWHVNAILNGQVLEDCEPYLNRADMCYVMCVELINGLTRQRLRPYWKCSQQLGFNLKFLRKRMGMDLTSKLN